MKQGILAPFGWVEDDEQGGAAGDDAALQPSGGAPLPAGAGAGAGGGGDGAAGAGGGGAGGGAERGRERACWSDHEGPVDAVRPRVPPRAGRLRGRRARRHGVHRRLLLRHHIPVRPPIIF